MGCRILDGRDDGAVLYCSTTDWAFGPIFRTYEHAEDFLKWLGYDPRSLPNGQLENKYGEWFIARCDDHGDLKEPDSSPDD